MKKVYKAGKNKFRLYKPSFYGFPKVYDRSPYRPSPLSLQGLGSFIK